MKEDKILFYEFKVGYLRNDIGGEFVLGVFSVIDNVEHLVALVTLTVLGEVVLASLLLVRLFLSRLAADGRSRDVLRFGAFALCVLKMPH